MTIHLPEHLESSIRDPVQGGEFASVDDGMAEAARLLVDRLKRPAPPRRRRPDPVSRSGSESWSGPRPFPMRYGTSCQPTLPSSTIIICMGRQSGRRHHEKVVC